MIADKKNQEEPRAPITAQIHFPNQVGIAMMTVDRVSGFSAWFKDDDGKDRLFQYRNGMWRLDRDPNFTIDLPKPHPILSR